MDKMKKILTYGDFKLIIVFAYIVSLFYLALKINWTNAILFHLFVILLFFLVYNINELIYFIISPILFFYSPINEYLIRRYIRNKKFKINSISEVVIVLGGYDYTNVISWIKPNYLMSDIKIIVKFLTLSKKDFSFYFDAKIEDIIKIMSDKAAKEVFFVGHGDSHSFQLNNKEKIYYCDFNDKLKYGKEFIHQVHCGDKWGKSLIDYLVPDGNKKKCFFFRKFINSFDVEKWFKNKIREL
ncbi:MAG: hypothetical protein GX447_09200 [Elusimicrobia bacterium]|nr:hypothetical protein [Elusimicrobiota bacterium]